MLIDKVFYEFESDSYNFEDYLIVPKNYKFTKLACKLNIIKDAVVNDNTSKNPDKFTKIGIINNVFTFLNYEYNIGYNGTEIDINFRDTTVIFEIACPRNKFKYFEVGFCKKEPYIKGANLSWIRACEYTNEDIEKGYTFFDFNKCKLNPKFSGYVINDRVYPKKHGYCFDGKLCIPFVEKEYNNYVNNVYNPESDYKDGFEILNWYSKKMKKFLESQNCWTVENAYGEKYMYEAKKYIFDYIQEYFKTTQKEREETLKNICMEC